MMQSIDLIHVELINKLIDNELFSLFSPTCNAARIAINSPSFVSFSKFPNMISSLVRHRDI